ncbi:hypothetical protein AVEN_50194-1 [Araneus ventricosus]|uniref:Uncharacterized protein n=1 Tax=Araneus ventricosus TaxID=182803 RepID=A0A4Y2WHZ3_ARAVE|nr:hypothetical protein AVEN_267109-1 [Araneus ventricosus]GBO36236.1 hypothetical protein AVEN_50194-1 [Araneus ventricosus]
MAIPNCTHPGFGSLPEIWPGVSKRCGIGEKGERRKGLGKDWIHKRQTEFPGLYAAPRESIPGPLRHTPIFGAKITTSCPWSAAVQPEGRWYSLRRYGSFGPVPQVPTKCQTFLLFKPLRGTLDAKINLPF